MICPADSRHCSPVDVVTNISLGSVCVVPLCFRALREGTFDLSSQVHVIDVNSKKTFKVLSSCVIVVSSVII